MRRELEWTPERVAICLKEAAETMRLLPGVIPKANLDEINRYQEEDDETRT